MHVDRFAEALTRRGHDLTVLTFSKAADPSYKVDRLRPHRAEHSSLAREYLVPWLWNAKSLRNYDVAHFHGDDWFFLRRQLPTVRTFHGSALREAQHATSWRRRIDKRLVFRLEIVAAKLATGAYGVGADEARLYHADGLLPIGVEPYAEVERRSPMPSVLFIGIWSGRKRGHFLYETFLRDVLPKMPAAELWMVSDECPRTPGVKWINAPSDKELGVLLSTAWVFCLPSTYEGFGIPYLEAMAHGTPVVATPNAGSEALLGDGRFGVLSSDRELGGSIVCLLKSGSLRDAVAASGRMRAGEYSRERCCVRHEEASETAMERWDARRA